VEHLLQQIAKKRKNPLPRIPDATNSPFHYPKPIQTSIFLTRLPKGIPRASRLKKDAERVGVAYRDEHGRYADFHALR
jgi:hypothetical protein